MENAITQRQSLSVLQLIEEIKNWNKQQSKTVSSDFICSKKNDALKKRNIKTSKMNDVGLLSKEEKISLQQKFDDMPVKAPVSAEPDLNSFIPREGDIPGDVHQNKGKSKFRFLKKGEGIARFRMPPRKISKTYNTKNSQTLKLLPAIHNEQNSQDNNVNKTMEDNKSDSTPSNSKYVTGSEIPTLDPPDLKLNFHGWKYILSNGKVKESYQTEANLSQGGSLNLNSSLDSSTASFMEKVIAMGKQQLIKEKHELQAFEALEQLLGNTSIDSTSSNFARLMESAVISTPIKNNDVSTSVRQLSTIHLENELKGNIIQSPELPNLEPPIWMNSDNISNGKTSLDADLLEQSLHVRFSEKVDYKSFAEYSQALDDSNQQAIVSNEKISFSADDEKILFNTNVESFNESEEWKENNAENSSCCSNCSTDYSSSDEDVKAISPPPVKNTKTLQEPQPSCSNIQEQVTNLRNTAGEKLTVADLENTSSNSTLLLKRKELEKEIEIFQAQNKELSLLRENLKKEQRQIQQEKKKLLKDIEEEKKTNLALLQQEKQKLAKEKLVFEKYSKSLTKNPTKEERKEIQLLRDQLAEMKEELNKKESRWGAAQARVRNQVKQLEEDNKKLRKEVEVLTKKSKHLEFLTQKKVGKSYNNTKLLHAINDIITDLPTEDVNNVVKKGYFNSTSETVKEIAVDGTDPKLLRNVRITKENIIKDNDTPTDLKSFKKNEQFAPNERETCNGKNIMLEIHESKTSIAEKSSAEPSKSPQQFVKETVTYDGSIEKLLPEGKVEVRYSNGNVKKIDRISGNEKIIYFNKDIKEIKSDGTIRYYFFESGTWHTTLPDGLEVLDFPDGQVEKRHKNGMKEITYPNGSKKICYTDGSEDIYYADGTRRKIDANKTNYILFFSNGQKEIKTEEFIRREYPNGTSKIVYPDGTSQTVYSNGRVRVKDKLGNLVMDSATSANSSL